MNIEEGVFRSKVYKVEGQKDVSNIKKTFFKKLEKKSSSRREKSAVIGMFLRNVKYYFFFC